MRLIAIVLCALAFTASDARADILELLKTHKIVVGKGCVEKGSKPCTPPPMNPQFEFRLVRDAIVRVLVVDKTGTVYPLNREEDIREHPLMAGYFQRDPFKFLYLKTMATSSENALILSFKAGTGSNPRDAFHSVYINRIEVSGASCAMTSDESTTGKSGYSTKSKFWYPCQLVPLETSAAATDAPKWRGLRFSNINYPDPSTKKTEKQNHSFELINDRLYYSIWGCADKSKLAIEFDWRGGSLQGNHECQSGTGRMTSHTKLSYNSTVKIDGNRRELTATVVDDQRGFAASKTFFDFDVRFVLDGGKCRIEKFHRKVTYRQYDGSPLPVLHSADTQSECFLD